MSASVTCHGARNSGREAVGLAEEDEWAEMHVQEMEELAMLQDAETWEFVH